MAEYQKIATGFNVHAVVAVWRTDLVGHPIHDFRAHRACRA
ncbi:hypothetical protein [Agrobacterium pusense]